MSNKRPPTVYQRIGNWIWITLDGSITVNAVRDLPDTIMIVLAGLIQASIMVVFVYFLVTGTQYNMNFRFLVPGDYDYSAGYCDIVLRSIPNGVYVADKFGSWSGMQSFFPEHSMYTFALNNYAGSFILS